MDTVVIRTPETCDRCKFDIEGTWCKSASRCASCSQFKMYCKCLSVKQGEPCPYFTPADDQNTGKNT